MRESEHYGISRLTSPHTIAAAEMLVLLSAVSFEMNIASEESYSVERRSYEGSATMILLDEATKKSG